MRPPCSTPTRWRATPVSRTTSGWISRTRLCGRNGTRTATGRSSHRLPDRGPGGYSLHVRVLIVEDDPELAGLLRDGLREHRIDPTLASCFADGRTRAAAGDYDVLVLDVRLPGGTGFELCRELRSKHVTTPVLMLTALDAVDDRVRGLEVGADDYLTKPFAFLELVARLKALARRRPLSLTPDRHRVADLEVDFGTREVRRGTRPIRLTAKEVAMLGLVGIVVPHMRPGRG